MLENLIILKRYGRVNPDGLASTILTKCDPHWGAYFHYDQDRVFSVREAARIQTFPDHFIFTGSKAEQYEQVGNAVPPFLAAAIGHSLAKYWKLGDKAKKLWECEWLVIFLNFSVIVLRPI